MTSRIFLGRIGVLLTILLAAGVNQTFAGSLLIIERVEVRQTKVGGKAWDSFGGLPDLKIKVERTSAPAGEIHITAPQKNRLKADFNRTAMEIDENDVLRITVLDDDVGKDDEIGTKSLKITSKDLKNKIIEVSFGQVIKLILRIK